MSILLRDFEKLQLILFVQMKLKLFWEQDGDQV